MEGQMVAAWKTAIRAIMAAFSIGLHQESRIVEVDYEKRVVSCFIGKAVDFIAK
jgi:hypothetical protein